MLSPNFRCKSKVKHVVQSTSTVFSLWPTELHAPDTSVDLCQHSVSLARRHDTLTTSFVSMAASIGEYKVPSWARDSDVFKSVVVGHASSNYTLWDVLEVVTFAPASLPRPMIPTAGGYNVFTESTAANSPTVSLPDAAIGNSKLSQGLTLSGASHEWAIYHFLFNGSEPA